MKMKLSYSISRNALKEKRYNDGTRSTKGTRPANVDYKFIRPIILKIMTNSVK